jgi:NAD(P)H dehydrogenase (quinone)
MSLLITGASGTLGRLVTDAVLARVDPGGVVLVTRDPSKLEGAAAEVRRGDFSDPGTLPDAFAGAEKVLLISTDVIGQRVPGHKAAIDAAVAAGARWIAYTSGINPSDSNPIAVMTEHRATEEHLRASGADWTLLRNSIYTEVLVPGGHAALASGAHVTNEGDGRVSYVSRADCAAAAAAVLTSDGHDGKIYDITGPAGLSATDVAALYAELGGKPVDVVQVDDEAYVTGMGEHAGMPASVARVYATFGIGARQGYSGCVSDTVEALTGSAQRPARDVLAPLLS